VWVPDLPRAVREWGWLLSRLGWHPYQDWPAGRSWRLGGTYLVVERSPDLLGDRHERRRPGLNHLAFHVAALEPFVTDGPANGCRSANSSDQPCAGGPAHRAAYLENSDGFEVELVDSAASGPAT
jgi:hypothetical protein